MSRYRQIIKPALIGSMLLGTLCWSSYLLDEFTGFPTVIGEEVPVIKGLIQATNQVGRHIADAGQWVADTTGLNNLMYSTGERLAQTGQSLNNQYPALEGAGNAFGKLVDSGNRVSKAVGGYFFPDPQAKAEQEKAEKDIAALKNRIAAKQKELKAIDDDIHLLEDQIRVLDRKANPASTLLPDGFSYLGVPSSDPDAQKGSGWLPLPFFPNAQSPNLQTPPVPPAATATGTCVCP
jgi:chaperonin cofactor prefoldin